MGLLSGAHLAAADADRVRLGIGLGRLLLSRKMISEPDLLRARSIQTGARVIDLERDPPDPRLIDTLGADVCLTLGLVPWRTIGGAVVVATPDPVRLDQLDMGGAPIIPALAAEADVALAILRQRSRQLARRAETRVNERESCRSWPISEVRAFSTVMALAFVAWAIVSPLSFVTAVLIWALLTMVASLSLKFAAAWLHLRHGPIREDDPEGATIPFLRHPEVSILVPLLRETEIAGTLIKRLEALEYPRELLEICLVVEASDTATKATIARTGLPPWFRVIEVPPGAIRTKPRALNFALDFCRGQVIGVYDAEDWPEPDQLNKVVARFARRGPEVACLQGRLDYYNPRKNWLSRAFTIEYAVWFGIVLPGLQRLGFAVPLGGTSLFFRRDALEALGAWDAHNVTEDADLGIRLARHGYRVELVDTVTHEEANCRLWPWIKQRARWLKGYAVTYAVHMRAPRQLLADLGPWRFFGFQVLFLGTLSQFVLAPLLWTFWPALFGLWHPFHAVLGAGVLLAVAGVFLLAEIVSVGVGVLAVWTPGKKYLAPWVLTLLGYFPFATVAAFRGLSELSGHPFYWDKTEHGVGTTADT